MLVAVAHRNSLSVGGWNNCGEVTLSLFVDLFLDVSLSIATSGTSSSGDFISLLFVACRDNASAACCLISLRCTTSKSNSDCQRHH